MNKRLYSFVLVLLFIVLSGCDTLFQGSPSGEVQVRIHNTSSYVMQDVTVSFPDQQVHYGDINPGKKSNYILLKKAYRYAYVETEIAEKSIVLQPIDYVGESLLDNGRYTYALSVYEATFESEDYRFSLGLELVKE